MTKIEETGVVDAVMPEDAQAQLHGGIPPFLIPVSGLYEWSFRFAGRIPTRFPRLTGEGSCDPCPATTATGNSELSFMPFAFAREELRLDVDGRYPQFVASGTLYRGLSTRVHWIANLTSTGTNRWSGSIWYKDGDATALPHTNVELQATRGRFPSQRSVRVSFSGGGAPARSRIYRFKSSYFHTVEFEYDTVQGTTKVTEIGTCDHPNRPASLPCETLSIESVFKRTRFDVTRSGGDGTIPISGTGANATWSDMEMHDAMQVFWSRFDGKAQWSMWVLFAALHDQGNGLGGIMFDDIGPNHRQGTAVFNDSFISNAPVGDSNPAAWIDRMRFWTVCHEMGHSFNLAHSWQKDHPPSWGTPWIPLSNENEVRSFMNYPFRVFGGQSAFFADFEYRFSDSELLFMRHAPARFVQMGNADWFDDHGFEQAVIAPEPTFRLEVRVNRAIPDFEFLEPVVLELKLTNTSSQLQLVDDNILSDGEAMTVIVKKNGTPARQWAPFAHHFFKPEAVSLAPGESIYESLFVSAGLSGFELADPGVYTIQVALHLEHEDIVSSQRRIRISPPRSFDEEFLAQDFFSKDVGRVLAFDGSFHLTSSNDTLREVVARLADRRVCYHARVALGNPLTRDYKTLTLEKNARGLTSACDGGGKFEVAVKQVDLARAELTDALITDASDAAETLGYIDYKYYMDGLSAWLDQEGDSAAASSCQAQLHRTLTSRNVLQSVLDQVEERRATYKIDRKYAARAVAKNKTKSSRR